MTNRSIPPAPASMLLNYVPRSEASEKLDVPPHMIEYWIAKRRVRIAEMKKDGEGKRSIYVNREDVAMLKDVYDLSVEMLQEENDDITYQEALDEFPEISQGLLHYLISNCLVDCYIPDRSSVHRSTLRKSDLQKTCSMIANVHGNYRTLIERNEKFLKRRDVNGIYSRMLYLYAFFSEFRQYNFHQIEMVNLRFMTVVVNPSSRLEYREGFNVIDLLLSGEMNGVIEEVDPNVG